MPISPLYNQTSEKAAVASNAAVDVTDSDESPHLLLIQASDCLSASLSIPSCATMVSNHAYMRQMSSVSTISYDSEIGEQRTALVGDSNASDNLDESEECFESDEVPVAEARLIDASNHFLFDAFGKGPLPALAAVTTLSESSLGDGSSISSAMTPFATDFFSTAEATASPPDSDSSRPEFIFVRVIKPNEAQPVGLFLKSNQDTKQVFISRINPTGLFAKSTLCPGDQVLSVNNVSCVGKTHRQVVEMIRNAKCHVAIVVHVNNGNSNLVSCTVQKPTPTAKVGVVLKHSRGNLHVSRINHSGLFTDSLLVAGHCCHSINGVSTDNLGCQDGVALIGDATEHVTIVTRPHKENGMVIACEPHFQVWHRLTIGFAVSAGAFRAMNSS